MTVIAYKDGVMAADSCSFCEGRRYPTFPKIVRAPDGSLAGVGGTLSMGQRFKAWFAAGMPESDRPNFKDEESDDFSVLLVRPDGTIWMAYKALHFFAVPQNLDSIGETSATDFCDGAMAAGLSAEAAVRLTIENCVYAGGEVQVERL